MVCSVPRKRFRTFLVGLAVAALAGGCPPPEFDPRDEDRDGDGFSPNQGDCADLDPNRFPGAEDTCNGIDDNCDGRVDEAFDLDQDGASSCNGGDCNDTDPTAFPGNVEISDGVDNDCNGIIDDGLIDFDDDGDCVCELAPCFGTNNPDCTVLIGGDCDDTQDLVAPGAIEVDGDEVDNDCDGTVDGPPLPCDGALDPSDPFSFAKAIGLCHGEVLAAEFITNGQTSGGVPTSALSNPQARAIINSFGPNLPFEGSQMIHLSSGAANTGSHDTGTDFGLSNEVAHPDPRFEPPANGCGEPDEPDVNDYTELKLTIQVPINAQSFSYKFQFFSSEYPTFRCDDFDDTFLAILDSEAFQGNISFDANGNVVSVNNGFFQVCFDDNSNTPPNDCIVDPIQPLSGTGYDPFGGVFSSGAGATLPLTTTSPVVPGEIITLRFIIFDEGDHILDSSVLIDGFVWQAEPAEGGPITIP